MTSPSSRYVNKPGSGCNHDGIERAWLPEHASNVCASLAYQTPVPDPLVAVQYGLELVKEHMPALNDVLGDPQIPESADLLWPRHPFSVVVGFRVNATPALARQLDHFEQMEADVSGSFGLNNWPIEQLDEDDQIGN